MTAGQAPPRVLPVFVSAVFNSCRRILAAVLGTTGVETGAADGDNQQPTEAALDILSRSVVGALLPELVASLTLLMDHHPWHVCTTLESELTKWALPLLEDSERLAALTTADETRYALQTQQLVAQTFSNRYSSAHGASFAFILEIPEATSMSLYFSSRSYTVNGYFAYAAAHRRYH